MGPSIILDKSSLQTLSSAELVTLKRFYSATIAPVLVIEILSDLKKKISGDRSPEQEVMQLAKKLYQTDSAVNVHYQTLIEGSLRGDPMSVSRRPVVGSGKYVQASDGRMGVILEETPEETALLRWQDGHFTDAETALAERWRLSNKSVDLEEFKKKYNASEDFANAIDLGDLLRQIDAYLLQHDSHPDLLKMMLLEFGFDFAFSSKVFMRWESLSQKSIRAFAPYAVYCFRANLVFYLGLIKNFLGTRATNRVDLEYVYYLPFCSVFSSKDKFHKQLVPLFLEPGQLFVDGHELKADLSNLSGLSISDASTGPPVNESSPTYKAWKVGMRSFPRSKARREESNPSKTNDRSKSTLDELNDLAAAAEITDPEILKSLNMSNVDFMVRKRTVRLDEPCFCHSGKTFRDCHWTPDMKPR